MPQGVGGTCKEGGVVGGGVGNGGGKRQVAQASCGKEGERDAVDAAEGDAGAECSHADAGSGEGAARRAFVQPEQVAGVEEGGTHEGEDEVGGADEGAAVVAKVQVEEGVDDGGVAVVFEAVVADVAAVRVDDEAGGTAFVLDVAKQNGTGALRVVESPVGDAGDGEVGALLPGGFDEGGRQDEAVKVGFFSAGDRRRGVVVFHVLFGGQQVVHAVVDEVVVGEDSGGGSDDEVEGQAGEAEQVVGIQPGAARAFVTAQGEVVGDEGGQVEDGAAHEGKGVEDGDDAHDEQAEGFAADGAGEAGSLVQQVGLGTERVVRVVVGVQGFAVQGRPVFVAGFVRPADGGGGVVGVVQGEVGGGFGVGGENGADVRGAVVGGGVVDGLRRGRPAVDGVGIEGECA